MTLRNNLTTDEYPLGVFHPHKEQHNIKKENIGLIEVMGLAVLPARLATELPIIEDCLRNKKELPIELDVHRDWVEELKLIYKDTVSDSFIYDQAAIKFMKCIEDAGVFKQDELGQSAFVKFTKGYIDVLNK
jgi:UDPglucose--hexose-1-phosphate uridylyltransferase